MGIFSKDKFDKSEKSVKLLSSCDGDYGMTHKIYAVRDEISGLFNQLLLFPCDAAALRAFRDALGSNGTIFSAHPEDYALYRLGSYRDNTGVITPEVLPELVMRGRTVLESLALDRSKEGAAVGDEVPLKPQSDEDVIKTLEDGLL